jgi:DNA-binding transcriptional LysR family regulator
MQQVRYFLALTETLNFSRAAEQCHVTQPALTRAIKALEGEFGGELIRREGKLSHLTDLGRRMLPLLKQCYDSALSAKAVAQSLAAGEARALSIGLSRTVDLRIIGPALSELFRAFPTLRLKLKRGNAEQLTNFFKSGEIELAIAGPLSAAWDRLDAWAIFSESFEMLVGPGHRLATSSTRPFCCRPKAKRRPRKPASLRRPASRWIARIWSKVTMTSPPSSRPTSAWRWRRKAPCAAAASFAI